MAIEQDTSPTQLFVLRKAMNYMDMISQRAEEDIETFADALTALLAARGLKSNSIELKLLDKIRDAAANSMNEINSHAEEFQAHYSDDRGPLLEVEAAHE